MFGLLFASRFRGAGWLNDRGRGMTQLWPCPAPLLSPDRPQETQHKALLLPRPGALPAAPVSPPPGPIRFCEDPGGTGLGPPLVTLGCGDWCFNNESPAPLPKECSGLIADGSLCKLWSPSRESKGTEQLAVGVEAGCDGLPGAAQHPCGAQFRSTVFWGARGGRLAHGHC